MAAPVHPHGVTGDRSDPATHAAISVAGTEFPPTRGIIFPIDPTGLVMKMAGDDALVAFADGSFKAGVLYPVSITQVSYNGVVLLW